MRSRDLGIVKLDDLRGWTRLGLRGNRHSNTIVFFEQDEIKITFKPGLHLSITSRNVTQSAEPKETFSGCGRRKTVSYCKRQICSVTGRRLNCVVITGYK